MEKVIHLGSNQECLNFPQDGGSHKSNKYYISRKTVLEMLRGRGYLVPKSEIELSAEQFRFKCSQHAAESHLGISFLHQSNTSDKVLVIFSKEDVMRKDGALSIATHATRVSSRLILVTNRITTPARKILETQCPFKAEIFQVSDLLVGNVLVNVTKHQLLSDEVKESHLKKHCIPEKQISSTGATEAKAEAEEDEDEEEAEEEEEEEEEGEEAEAEPEAEAASGSLPHSRKKRKVESSISDPSRYDNTKADITEYDTKFTYIIDMPGMKHKNEIHVQLINKKLVKVRGVREQNPYGGNAINYLSTERSYRFRKTFTLPEGADPQRISAGYEDGLLTLTVDKLSPEPDSKQNIEVKFR